MIDYYTTLLGCILLIISICYNLELWRKRNGKKNDVCTYCGCQLGNNFSMSYGIPGIPRVYKCKRWWCNMGKYLGYLEKNYLKNEVN